MGHEEHVRSEIAVASVSSYVPGAQTVVPRQILPPAVGRNVEPTVQLVHEALLATLENVPARHAVHSRSEALVGALSSRAPGGHDLAPRQPRPPTVSAYLPAAHTVHSDSSMALEYLPTAQSLHTRFEDAVGACATCRPAAQEVALMQLLLPRET